MLGLLLLAGCSDHPVATEPLGPLANVQATDVCDGVSVSLAECEALVALFNSTNGPDWGFSNANWGTATNPCHWAGVVCANDPLGPIQILFLDQRNLTGTLPAELANLTELEVLALDINNLTGVIPSGLGTLIHLHRLSLSENDLTGTIPASLSNLDELRSLNLVANQLTGSIPAGLGQLPKLEQIALTANQLTGPIPSSFGSMPALQLLRLNSNQLSGTIPPALGNAVQLFRLDLSNNALTGLVPLSVALLGGRIEALDPLASPSVPGCDLSGNAGLYLPDVETYRAADLDQDGLLCGMGFTPVAQVGDDAVDTVDELPLNDGLTNALTKKIQNAIAKADAGHYQAAINQMEAFINQLQTLVNNATLTEAQAAPLFEQADELITVWSGLL